MCLRIQEEVHTRYEIYQRAQENDRNPTNRFFDISIIKIIFQRENEQRYLYKL